MLEVRLTDRLRRVLQEAADKPEADKGLAEEIKAAAASGTISWKLLQEVSLVLRTAGQGPPWLHKECRGAELLFPKPPERHRSDELKARLVKLQAAADQRRYDAMVQEVTKHEREADALREGGLRTYKQQLSFGLQVLVMMASFYAMGHVVAAFITEQPALRAAAGLAGLILAMMAETILLILRSSYPTGGQKTGRKPARTLQKSSRQQSGARDAAGMQRSPDLSPGHAKPD